MVLPTDKPEHGWFGWLLLAFGIMMALQGTQQWIQRILHIAPKPQLTQLLDRTGGWPMFVGVAAIVVLGPAFEELFLPWLRARQLPGVRVWRDRCNRFRTAVFAGAWRSGPDALLLRDGDDLRLAVPQDALAVAALGPSRRK
jgi:predicted lysophospholipase L1 biosynthesis ABC-type transport system permease subunit